MTSAESLGFDPVVEAQNSVKKKTKQKVDEVVAKKDQGEVKKLLNEMVKVAESFEVYAGKKPQQATEEAKIESTKVAQESNARHKALVSHTVVAEYLEAVRNKQIDPPSFTSPASEHLFNQLVEKVTKSELHVEGSPFILKLLHRVVTSNVASPFEVLTNDELNVVFKSNPDAFEQIMELVKGATVASGRPESEFYTFQSKLEKSFRNQKDKKDKGPKLSEAEKAEFESFKAKLRQFYKRGATTDLLSEEEVMDYVFMGDTATEMDEKLTMDRARKALEAAGFSPVEISQFFSLGQKERYYGDALDTLRRGSFQDIAERMEQLTENFILSKLFEPSLGQDGRVVRYNWNEDGAEDLRRYLNQTVGALFRNLTEDPTADPQESFTQYNEGSALREIRRRFAELGSSYELIERFRDTLRHSLQAGSNLPLTPEQELDVERQTEDFRAKVRRFFRKVSSDITQEKNYQTLAHQTIKILATASLEDQQRLMQKTEFGELANLMQNPLIEKAVPFFVDVLQERLARSDNRIDKDLFGFKAEEGGADGPGRYYLPLRDEFINKFRGLIQELRDKGQLDRDPEEWEINRAYAFSNMIAMMLTGQGTMVMANARITLDHYGDEPLAAITSILRGNRRWGAMRGHVTNDLYMFGIPVKIDPQQVVDERPPSWMAREHWDPERIRAEAQHMYGRDMAPGVSLKRDADGNIIRDDTEMDRLLALGDTEFNKTWVELMETVALPTWFDRGGWRLDGVKVSYKKDTGKDWGGSWDERFQWIDRYLGVGSRFYYTKQRAGDDAEGVLMAALEREGLINWERDAEGNKITLGGFKEGLIPAFFSTGLYEGEDYIGGNPRGIPFNIDAIRRRGFSSYEEYRDKARTDKILKVTRNGKEENISFNQYSKERRRALEGEVFYRGLRRDPIGFLNNLTQLVPEITTGFKTVGNKVIKASEYYFSDDIYAAVDQGERENIDLVRYNLYKIFTKDNQDDIKYVMDIYYNLAEQFQPAELPIDETNEDYQNGLKRAKDEALRNKRASETAEEVHRAAEQQYKKEYRYKGLSAEDRQKQEAEDKAAAMAQGLELGRDQMFQILTAAHYAAVEDGNSKDTQKQKDGKEIRDKHIMSPQEQAIHADLLTAFGRSPLKQIEQDEFFYLWHHSRKNESKMTRAQRERLAELRQSVTMSDPDIDKLIRMNSKQRIRDLVLGEQGIFKHFEIPEEKMHEEFGNGAENLGNSKNFFTRYAKGWFRNEGSNNGNKPNMDRNVRRLVEEPENPDTIKRGLGDLKAMKEIQDKLYNDLPNVLGEISLSGDFSKIYGFIDGYYGPMAQVDEPWAQEFTSQVAQMVSRYFEEMDGDAILPVSIVQKFRKGPKISMSRLRYGPQAYSHSGDEMIEFLRILKEKRQLPENLRIEAQNALQVDFPRMLWSNILPNWTMMLMVFLIWQYGQKAYEENTDKG